MPLMDENKSKAGFGNRRGGSRGGGGGGPPLSEFLGIDFYSGFRKNIQV